MSLAKMLTRPLIINLIKNQNNNRFKEIAGCIIEDSDILTTLSATITEKNVQLLESKKGLFSLMEHAMRQPITSKTHRYVTASFCSKGKPVWDCNDVFTSSMYFMANPLKEVFSCSTEPNNCDDASQATLTLSYDPRQYERTQLHAISVSNNLSLLRLFLKVFETLAWLDVTSYLLLFVYWIALYSSKVATDADCVGQNCTPCTETLENNAMESTKCHDPQVTSSSSKDFDEERMTSSTTESMENARKGQRESVQIPAHNTQQEDYPMENLAKDYCQESKTNNTGEEIETDLSPN